ncbi:hypothetical protein G9A89_015168 [Geosiphon pyriformis]|nr:hypothetical protein G9A89_015168 [Geosiphon pyriformis]
MLLGELFSGAESREDMDAIWAVLEEAVVEFTDVTFLRYWFNKFRCLRNKHSSKFFGLELLVAKIVKAFRSDDLPKVNCLVSRWSTLDDVKAHAFDVLFCSSVKSEVIVKHLSLVCRDYRRSKMFELRLVEKASIRKAIERCIENFCLDKDSIIKSVLNRPFHKVVLDYLVVNNKLILEPEEVKKCSMLLVLSDLWAHQYASLEYVWNDAFSGVMCAVNMDELLLVVFSLSDGKTAGFGKVALRCLLKLLNVCLTVSLVPALWKEAWIFSKILFDCILVACSKFNVLQDNNFSVLKDMSTQSLVFAIRSVVKNALEKNREVWLVLQEMQKAYNLDRVNRVMTDFGLSGGYKRIFYDLLLCEVKRHKQLCGYQIDTRFVLKTRQIESGGSLTLYFSAGAFYTLNIASEFFEVNDISINSEKTVAIPINQDIKVASLNICGQPISIAKKGKMHHYLGIFLFTERLSKPSVTKAHADICFFVNVMLRKAITDKQFLYLVSAVLQSIVSYHIQFSFVPFSVCCKWNVLVRKSLRSKACLFHDFPNATLHHFSLYGLKPFEQVQSKGKVTALIMFFNAFGILGHLFSHRFLDLQVLGWAPLDPLQFSVRLRVNPVNNFLAGLFKIFLDNELSLANNFLTAFHNSGHFSLSFILGKSLYFDLVKSLKCFGIAFGNQLFDKKSDLLDWKTFCHWKRLDLCSSVPHWFVVASKFFLDKGFSSSDTPGFFELHRLDVLGSSKFSAIKDRLHDVWLGFFEVYTDGSLKNAGSAEVVGDVATYFSALDLSVGVVVRDLFSSTMAKLQTVALSLEIPGNVRADLAVGTASGSPFLLLANMCKHFLVAEGTAVSGNAHHFVQDIFWSVCCAYWEAGPSCNVVLNVMVGCMDWVTTSLTFCSYMMKAMHRKLPVAVRKRLYNRCYSDVLCLLCGGVEFSDHAFTCVHESDIRNEILAEASVLLSQCSIDVGLYALVCKEFVLDEWLREACCVVNDQKLAVARIVNFAGLVWDGGVVSGLFRDVSSLFSDGVVRLLGMTKSFAVSFGYQKPCSFFFGLRGGVQVIIGV